MNESEQDLKDQFQRMRAEDAAWAPSFDRVMLRRRARRRSWAPLLALATATAVVALVLVARHRPRSVEPPFTIAVGDLRMPTDFLLDIQSVPSIGRSDDWFANLPGLKGHPL